MTHRVAVIGNGPSVAEHIYGAQIDACDEVVRINTFRIGLPWTAHVGSKITVWCGYQPPRDELLELGLRDMWWIEFGYINLEAQRQDTQAWCMRHNLRWTWVPDSEIEVAFEALHITATERSRIGDGGKPKDFRSGMKPSTGIIAICCALREWPESEIYIAGFDGFPFTEPMHYWDKEQQMTPHYCRRHYPERQREYVERLIAEGRVKEFA